MIFKQLISWSGDIWNELFKKIEADFMYNIPCVLHISHWKKTHIFLLNFSIFLLQT